MSGLLGQNIGVGPTLGLMSPTVTLVLTKHQITDPGSSPPRAPIPFTASCRGHVVMESTLNTSSDGRLAAFTFHGSLPPH